MTAELSLFDLPGRLLFQRGSPTSKEAALGIAEDLNDLQRLVLTYFVSRGEAGATYRDVMQATGLCSGTVCPRIAELKEMGLLVATVRRVKKAGVVVAKQFYGKAA